MFLYTLILLVRDEMWCEEAFAMDFTSDLFSLFLYLIDGRRLKEVVKEWITEWNFGVVAMVLCADGAEMSFIF